ncbi:MAG: STAS domain-containing protein [Nevskia sp.]|nr:STAS domain-containing protein [Nevskia sp.]
MTSFVLPITQDLTLPYADLARREVLDTINASLGQVLVLDLSRVACMDTAGLGVLVGAYKAIKARGGVICLQGVQPRVMEVLKATRLDLVFDIVAAQAPARAAGSA